MRPFNGADPAKIARQITPRSAGAKPRHAERGRPFQASLRQRRARPGAAALTRTMEVFAVTVFVSLMFAVLFAVLFIAERSQRRRHSLEHDALLPLDDGPSLKPRTPPLS